MTFGNSLTLVASLRPAALDARRGIVRMHAEIFAALGIQAGDPVRLTGRRSTTAIALAADTFSSRRALYADDLTLGNLGVRDASPVTVTPVSLTAARRVVLSGPVEVAAVVSGDTLRLALLSKVVSAGDNVSLLPMDISGPERDAVEAARRSLSNTVGAGWTSVLLTVDEVEPAEAAMITSDTLMSWAGQAPNAPVVVPHTLSRPVGGGTETPAQRTAPSSRRPPIRVESVVGAAAEPAAAEVVEAEVVSMDDLAGIGVQAEELRELLDLGFNHREVLTVVGTEMTLGVLVTGPPGTGKTTMIRSVSDAVGANLVHVRAPEIAALAANDAAARLREAVDSLRPPAVLLVTGVGALAPAEESTPLSTVFRTTVRDLVAAGHAVVCTTANPEELAPALRQAGMLEHEIVVPMPDVAARKELLTFFTRTMRVAADVRLDEVASSAPGYVAADLRTLAREAGVRAAMRAKEGGATALQVEDFKAALQTVRPSSMAGDAVDVGQLTLDDVGGMADVKQTLTESVLWPLTYPDTFTRLGIEAPRGVLLYGPPGCGKTYLVKAIAGSGKSNVLSVKGSELLTKWVGESERSVRDLFRRARQAAPTLMFFDELDALTPVRGQSTDSGTADRVVAAMLTELDGVESLRNVVVIGATNRPDMIDPALLRPGRLERLVYVPPPDGAARTEILRAAARSVPLADDVDLDVLGAELENYSAADCAALVRESALTAMRESLEASTVTAAHVTDARTRVRPSLNPAQLAALESYADSRRS